MPDKCPYDGLACRQAEKICGSCSRKPNFIQPKWVCPECGTPLAVGCIHFPLPEKQPIQLPFKCPVCRGNGLVPNGFYRQVSGDWLAASLEPDKCRSCNGSGIVWRQSEVVEFTFKQAEG